MKLLTPLERRIAQGAKRLSILYRRQNALTGLIDTLEGTCAVLREKLGEAARKKARYKRGHALLRFAWTRLCAEDIISAQLQIFDKQYYRDKKKKNYRWKTERLHYNQIFQIKEALSGYLGARVLRFEDKKPYHPNYSKVRGGQTCIYLSRLA